MPARTRNTIEVVINATDNASDVLRGIGTNAQEIGKVVVGAFAGVATGITAAMGAAVTKGLAEFQTFEAGMNEIFTLMPNVTQEAMDSMTEDIQAFSARMGVLSEDAIPAVYQALSAGVPQDNVFEFLEVAQKAALGGVTDLETAVDGITSVLNAYGTETMSATEASDLMFRAVVLGKTTFEELSASLFNVAPVAASMGIGFENITAAIAALTAQGVPTSVATTQMRAAFTELADSGSDVGKAFTEVAGQSFRDFMASGGNLADALDLVSQAAEATGKPIDELFGSVEAAQAVLGLTGANADTFRTFLDDMANSAGATDAAFQQMNQGIGRAFDRLAAKTQNFFVNIGALVAPMLTPIIDGFGNVIQVLANVLNGTISFGALTEALEKGGEAISKFGGNAGVLRDALAEVPAFFRPIMRILIPLAAGFRRLALDFDPNNPDGFVGALKAGVPAFAVFITEIRRVMSAMGFSTEVIDSVANAFITLRNVASQVATFIGNLLAPMIEWIQQNIELKDVLIALGIAIGSFLIATIAGLVAAFAPVIATFAILVAGVALLRKAWDTNFMGIQDRVEQVTDFFTQTFVPTLRRIFTWITSPTSFKIADIFERLGFSPQHTIAVVRSVRRAMGVIKDLFSDFVDTIRGGFGGDGDSNFLSRIFDGILSVITKLGRGFIYFIDVFSLFINNLSEGNSVIDALEFAFFNAGINVGRFFEVLRGVGEKIGFVIGYAEELVDIFSRMSIGDAIRRMFTDGDIVGSLGIFLRNLGLSDALVTPIMDALFPIVDGIVTWFEDLGSIIHEHFGNGIQNVDWKALALDLLRLFADGFMGIATWINDTFIMPLVDAIKEKFQAIDWTAVGQSILDGLGVALQAIGAGATWVNDHLILPLFNAAKEQFIAIDWGAVGQSLMDGLGTAIATLGTWVTWIIDNVLSPLVSNVSTAVTSVDWSAVATTLLEALGSALLLWTQYITWLYDNVLMPIVNIAGQAIESVDWYSVGAGIVNAIGFALKATFDFIAWIINSIFNPTVEGSEDATEQTDWSRVGNAILHGIGAFLTGAFDFVMWLFTNVLTPLVLGAADAIAQTDWSAVGTGIMDAIGNALGNIAEWVNMHIIQPISDALGAFDPMAMIGMGNEVSVSPAAGFGVTPSGGIFASGGSATSATGGIQTIQGFQFGGHTSAGVPIRVGEAGPEMFVPSTDGNIMNAQDTEAMRAGGSPISIQFVFQRSISDNEARESASKLKRELQAQGISVEGTF